jgi:hypothetical protein
VLTGIRSSRGYLEGLKEAEKLKSKAEQQPMLLSSSAEADARKIGEGADDK